MIKEDPIENFKDQMADFGVMPSEFQLQQLLEYYELLVDKNKVMNLTSITDFNEVMQKHFLDSLSLVKAIDLADKHYRILDLGTGAGFPGIPLKIIFPNLKLVLLDSVNKKIVFLKEVIEALDLQGIEAIHDRAEDLARQAEYRESFDLCVSRAVAKLSSLSEYCLPFVKIDGYFISYKSADVEEEIINAQKAIRTLGGRLEKRECFPLSNTDMNRALVKIKKIKSTPNQYPRKAGTPVKNPL